MAEDSKAPTIPEKPPREHRPHDRLAASAIGGDPGQTSSSRAHEKVMGSSRRRHIELQFEFEFNRVRLGLVDQFEPIPIGADGRFSINALLGKGSMGAVYRAYDEVLGRDVAVKVVTAGSLDHERLEQRLAEEAQALASVRHENVLVVHDVGRTETGELFIAMDYVAGVTLDEWQVDRPLLDILSTYVAAGRGLAAVHKQHIVHRDFKPHNVFVSEDDGARRVVVGDFGLARRELLAQPEPLESQSVAPSSALLPAARSAGVGTLGYMPPEQASGIADARADQYAFCVALWESVVGQRPFAHPRQPEQPLPPRPPSMPAWLHGILSRGLKANPDDRFATMDDIVVRLAWFCTPKRARSMSLDVWQREREAEDILLGYRVACAGLAAAHRTGQSVGFVPSQSFVSEADATDAAPIIEFHPHSLVDEGRGAETGLASSLLTDQHEFCLALWTALTGHAPPPGAPLRRPTTMSRAVFRLLRRGLSPDPDRRYADMSEVLRRLEDNPWRRWGPALAGIGLAVFGAAWLVHEPSPDDPCQTAGDPMEQVWSAETRERVERTQTSYIIDSLDDAAQQWQHEAQTACEVRVSGDGGFEHERREHCLMRWLERFDHHVQRLASGDPEVAAHVLEWLEPVVAGDRCAMPPPILATSVRRALEESEDAELIADVELALARAELALTQARDQPRVCKGEQSSPELGYAHLRLAFALDAAGQPSRALEHLQAAKLSALACEEDRLFIDTQLRTSEVSAIELEDTVAARRVLDEADVVLAKSTSVPSLLLAERAEVSGHIRLAEHDYAGAREDYGRALELIGEDLPSRCAKLHQNIGAAHQRERSWDAATRAYRRSYACVADSLGPSHPRARTRAATLAANQAIIAIARGDANAALEHVRAAALDGKPDQVAKVYAVLITSHQRNEEPDQAAEVARELQALTRSTEFSARTRAEALTTIGMALTDVEDQTSIRTLEEALELWTQLEDPKSQAYCEYYLTIALCTFGRDAEGIARLEALRATAAPSADPVLAQALESMDGYCAVPSTQEPSETSRE